MKPYNFSQIIEGKKYDTSKATLLAGNDFWDGHNFERHGTNSFLYVTPKKNYFLLNLTQWQGSFDNIEPLNKELAKEFFEKCQEKRVSWEEAFQGEKLEEA